MIKEFVIFVGNLIVASRFDHLGLFIQGRIKLDIPFLYKIYLDQKDRQH